MKQPINLSGTYGKMDNLTLTYDGNRHLQGDDSISNREKDTLSDSIPLKQTLIPPKQIDDLHNFQVVYCLDVYGDRKFVWCHIHNFCFKGKLYEPRFMIAYRKSVTDTLAEMHGLGFLEHPKWEYEKDRA